MAEIARIDIDLNGSPDQAWCEIAQAALAWLREAGVPPRDACVLVPLAQHLPAARQAFGHGQAWIPRIETVRTLSASLAPVERGEGALSFDMARDRLCASALLRGLSWGREAAARDPRAFNEAVARLVDCAHRLAQVAAACAPSQRAAWQDKGRDLLTRLDGPGGTERLLARVAFEWVGASSPWNSDNLFELAPAAWVAVQVAGSDPLAVALMAAAPDGVPCLRLQADPVPDDSLSQAPQSARLLHAVAQDFEDEAERAAAQLLAWGAEGLRPLLLVAQDRLLVRRVSALLARQQVPVLDETGWKLSTTRAAAGVMALLRAASPGATMDELLDWLKAVPGAPGVDALELAVRRHACTRVQAVAGLKLEDAAAAGRDWALQRLAGLSEGPAFLGDWMRRLATVLQASGQTALLQDDLAGAQVLRALQLDQPDAAGSAGLEGALRWSEFVQWVDEVLEQSVFEPGAPAQAPAVVITPLRRAVLRPFAAALLPAADDARLGAAPAPDALLGEGLATALGLPSIEERRRDEAAALVQLLRLPLVAVSYRVDDDGVPREPSPLVERLLLQRERAGHPAEAAADARLGHSLRPQPQQRPAPRAGQRLPQALSASAVEALRDCPYRFFSRSVLRLKEPDELDDAAEKRDYGNWLHEVLHVFHRERPAPRSEEQDLRELRRLALQQRQAMGLDAASFLPFEASFERFAPLYARWLRDWDAEGGAWSEGETDREAEAPGLGPTRLRGRLDRIDEHGGRRRLLDYKTVSVDALRKRVREPLEDTQLAFYAALERLAHPEAPPLEAGYLALDEAERIHLVRHEEVERSAGALLLGLAGELQRLRAGEPMVALGEGAVCEHCEVRGLCRRDHWTDSKEPTV